MKISVLGCGWLGLPLAKELLLVGHSVKGSTTTPPKLPVLEKNNIAPYLLNLNNDDTEISDFLKDSDVLIINVPPKANASGERNYLDKMKLLLSSILNSSIKHVLFVSSTSVYSDDNKVVNELTALNPQSDSAKLLVKTESLFQKTETFTTTIIRFGGLIGEDRHPANSLAGRKEIPNPDAPVNLIWRADCVKLIIAIINNAAWGEVFNAAATNHPSREFYYTNKANQFGLQPPQFNHSVPSIGKTINSDKIAKRFNFTFTDI